MPKMNVLTKKDENTENVENVEPKGKNKTIKTGKKSKNRLAEGDLDLEGIIKANQDMTLVPKKQQVENCPHMANKEEHQFMCTTCRVICCEPCLRMNHHGEQHRWCELMPYEPSDTETTHLEIE